MHFRGSDRKISPISKIFGRLETRKPLAYIVLQGPKLNIDPFLGLNPFSTLLGSPDSQKLL